MESQLIEPHALHSARNFYGLIYDKTNLRLCYIQAPGSHAEVSHIRTTTGES